MMSIIYTHNIIERKQKEEAARQKEEEFRLKAEKEMANGKMK